MQSKWFHLKSDAIALRKKGHSIGFIEKQLGIPRSTLSGWLRNITLTSKQKQKLRANWKNALVTARKGAVKWHNAQKQNRLLVAKNEALQTLSQIDTDNPRTIELALAVLYLAEGSKKNIETALGSSDPVTLRFFLKGLQKVFNYNVSNVRCELHLRADQDPEMLKKYWAKELGVPTTNFKQINIDKRSLGKKTYDHYKGVCSLRCGNVAIRRRLVYLAEEYFAIIARH